MPFSSNPQPSVINPNLVALLVACVYALTAMLPFKKQLPCHITIIPFAIAVVYLQSVTGIIALACIYLFAHAKHQSRRGTRNAIILCFLTALLITNRASVTGRIHILRINLQLLAQTFPAGVKSYSQAYNHRQIAFFMQQGIHHTEARQADESVYALNDILQLTILYGLPGLLVIGILYVMFFYAIVLHKKQPGHVKLKRGILLLLPFYIFIPVSYPLQVPLLAGTFILCHLPLLLYFTNRAFNNRLRVLFRGIIIIAALVFTCLFIPGLAEEIRYRNRMNTAIENWDAGYHTRSFEMLEELGDRLDDNRKFIYHKAKYLYLSGSPNALNFLLTHHKQGCGYDYHILCGDIYKERSQSGQAAAEYTNALYLVPHKLESRYKLMELYQGTGDADSTCYYARQLLSVPAKINNPRGDFYKQKAAAYLYNRQ